MVMLASCGKVVISGTAEVHGKESTVNRPGVVTWYLFGFRDLTLGMRCWGNRVPHRARLVEPSSSADFSLAAV